MTEPVLGPLVHGVHQEEWDAAYATNVRTFFATRTVAAGDGSAVRIAFGLLGAPSGEQGQRKPPIYEVAIAMPPDVALRLAQLLQSIITVAAPDTYSEAPASDMSGPTNG